MNSCWLCGIRGYGTDPVARGQEYHVASEGKVLDPLFRLVSLLGFKEMYDLSGSEVTCQVAALLHTTGLPSHA